MTAVVTPAEGFDATPRVWLTRLLTPPVAAVKAAVGLLCAFTPLGGILLLGWGARVAQREVARAWWRAGVRDTESPMSFSAWAQRDPATRKWRTWPNWSIAQDVRAAGEKRHTSFRRAIEIVGGSLIENARLGLQTFLNSSVLLAPCAVLWQAGWGYGWENSFNKGYEQSWVGPTLWWLGWLAFVVVMSHLPLAQIHHAVTGEWRAYYRWKEIRVLRRATTGAHAALAVLFAIVMLPITVLLGVRTFPLFENVEVEKAAGALNTALALYGFLGFFVLRFVAAQVYARATRRAYDRDTAPRETVSPKTVSRRTVRLPDSPAWNAVFARWTPSPSPSPGLPVRTLRRGWRLSAGGLAVLAWTALSFQYVLIVFTTAPGWSHWWTQPLVQAPWFARVHVAPLEADSP